MLFLLPVCTIIFFNIFLCFRKTNWPNIVSCVDHLVFVRPLNVCTKNEVWLHMIHWDIISFYSTSFSNTFLKFNLFIFILLSGFDYPVWLIFWMIYDLLDSEHLLKLRWLTQNLNSSVKLSAHDHEIFRIAQGEDRISCTKWTLFICSLTNNDYFLAQNCSFYHSTRWWIRCWSAATCFQCLSTDSVLADVVTVSCANQDKWILIRVVSWTREQSDSTPVSASESSGLERTLPGTLTVALRIGEDCGSLQSGVEKSFSSNFWFWFLFFLFFKD